MRIALPTECPSCGSDNLELVKDLLYCRNGSCPAQSSGKLQKFCKTLKIKGFGPATIDKSGIKTIPELVSVTEENLKNKGFSDTMATKLTKAVSDRLKVGITVSDFLAACSIENIGAGTARKLSHLLIDDITFNKCKEAGLGDVAANSLISWLELEWPKLKELDLPISQTSESVEEKATVCTVCVTGKLDDFSSRSKAAEYLKTKGIEVKSSVTKAVDYLICEDGKTTSSSYKKAIAMGKPIKTIKQLLEEI